MSMRINQANTPNQNIKNVQHVGAQRAAVRQKDIKAAGEEQEDISSDGVSISDQAKHSRKAGETSGMAGSMGAQATGKNKETKETKETKSGMAAGNGGYVPDESEPDYPPGTGSGNASFSYSAADAGNTAGSGGPGGPTGPGRQSQGTGSADGSGGSGSTGSAQQASPSEQAAKSKELQDDMQKARTIYTQMALDRQKWMHEMWKMIMDTQAEIMKILNAVAANRAKVFDSISQMWSEVIRGPR